MDDSLALEGETVVCRVDANKRMTIVFVKDDEGETRQYYFKSVLLKDAEFGYGLIRGVFQEGWKYQLPSRLPQRGYFNKNHCTRYINKFTKKILTESPAVMTTGSSVTFV